MIIDCISDLHGHCTRFDGGDILIVAGDCTASHTLHEWDGFFEWLEEQPYDDIVLVGGNHDDLLQNRMKWGQPIHYLENSMIEIEGIKIYGSPWTPRFVGQNPHAMAFTNYRYDMKQYWDKIPDGIDILVTHGPPMGILDIGTNNSRVGDDFLLDAVKRVKPKYHVFGHLHECHGQKKEIDGTTYMNVAAVDERYRLQEHGASRIVL